MVKILTRLGLAVFLFATSLAPLSAQGATRGPLRVFFDCEGPSCDEQFYRTEIDWVDWVRNREDADIHLIMSSQSNASGGRSYDISFLGQGELEGVDDELVFQSLGTDVEQERLDGIANTLAIGFARYASLLGLRNFVEITGTRPAGVDPEARVVGAEEVQDPWNLWSFRVSGNVNVEGEDTRSSRDIGGSLSADRVTPEWILGMDLRFSSDRVEIERNDGSVFENVQDDWSVNTEVVFAIADHWSVGFVTASGKLPRFNQDLRLELRPGLEYSYFPYPDATRRALTAYYQIGPTFRDYEEETVFGETSETRFEESLRLEFAQRQPWGNASISAEGTHFLHDMSLFNISFFGNVEFRLFRGLSLDVRGDYSFGDNQIYLSAEGQTDEEILLRLQQRQSTTNYGLRVGFNYRFGSIFNNVVNNRFDGRSGGFGGF